MSNRMSPNTTWCISGFLSRRFEDASGDAIAPDLGGKEPIEGKG